MECNLTTHSLILDWAQVWAWTWPHQHNHICVKKPFSFSFGLVFGLSAYLNWPQLKLQLSSFLPGFEFSCVLLTSTSLLSLPDPATGENSHSFIIALYCWTVYSFIFVCRMFWLNQAQCYLSMSWSLTQNFHWWTQKRIICRKMRYFECLTAVAHVSVTNVHKEPGLQYCLILHFKGHKHVFSV